MVGAPCPICEGGGVETGAGEDAGEGSGVVGVDGGGERECVFALCRFRLVAGVKVLVQEGQLILLIVE